MRPDSSSSSDLTIGPLLTAYIEVDVDTDAAQLVELRIPFVPRAGESIVWGPVKARCYAEITEVNWVFGEKDEEGVTRVQHVNLVAETTRADGGSL